MEIHDKEINYEKLFKNNSTNTYEREFYDNDYVDCVINGIGFHKFS